MSAFLQYMTNNSQDILSYLLQHVRMTCIAVIVATLIGVPLGIFINYYSKLSKPILGFVNVIQAIPSVAMLGFAIPFLGIGTKPAVIMVVLYSLLPIVKNTFIGIQNISPDIIEVAEGIGLKRSQILQKIQIPLALPVIMSGVRIAAVTAVGLMTIAAFIGAGGLGYLVFSGIRTVDNGQVLAGAIPACILALVVDWAVGLVEKLVTPVNIQKEGRKDRERYRRRRHWSAGVLAFVLCCMVVLIALPLFTSGSGKSDKTIRIGAKDFTEQLVVGNMLADLIEDKTDITAQKEFNMGSTQAVSNALTSNALDLYVEYTGTAYVELLKYPASSDESLVYQTVKKDYKSKFNVDVLDQMGFNDTYTLAVKPETAQQYGLKTISDLSKVASQLTAGTTLEFLNRADCLPGLKKTYGFSFKKEVGIDGSPRYVALENSETDVVDAFSTDGLLKKFGLTVLTDDKNYFPPYYAIPLIRDDTLKAYPEVEPLINELGKTLTNEVMMNLNYEVDIEQKKPEDVAHQYLVQQGLIEK